MSRLIPAGLTGLRGYENSHFVRRTAHDGKNYRIYIMLCDTGKEIFMAEEKALKPKTFRINEETAEKIRKIAETIGGNQQEAFAKLIEAYEFQSSKAVLTEQKANIGQFEKYANALTRMYMVSLEANQTITETVRTEFDALLKSKDTVIQELQAELAAARKSMEELVKQAEECGQKNAKFKELLDSKESEYTTQLENLQVMITDKENLNHALTESYTGEKQRNDSLQEKINALRKENQELSSSKAELSDLRTEHGQLIKKKESLEKEWLNARNSYEKMMADLKQQSALALEQSRQQAQFELDKAILGLERQYQEQIQTLKEQKQSEVDKYQQKYFSLLEKLKEGKQASDE